MTFETALPNSIHNNIFWAFTRAIHNPCSYSIYSCAPNCMDNVREYIHTAVNEINGFPLRNHDYSAVTNIIKSYDT